MLLPRDVLLRLRALGYRGLALLESVGEQTPFGRYSYLSAQPVRQQTELPARPSGDAVFPAWLGGLTYEAASELGLRSHPVAGVAQFWGYYPSGLVWDHQENILTVVGEPHLNWDEILAAEPVPLVPLHVGTLHSECSQAAFEHGVREVQHLIEAGECYQVNLSQRLHADYVGDPMQAYLRLAEVNPSPFMAYFEGDGFTVVSCSPERLVLWEGNQLSARPIAGTRRRGDTPEEDLALQNELLNSEKERAEHVMLLDLERNDLGRVAEGGSVWVSEFMTVERYSHVMHLVSEVRATAQSDLTIERLLRAVFPGGTITGAPKRRVMEAIAHLEPSNRGWYTGLLGLLSGAKVDTNILIRTLEFVGDEVRLSAGAGIVIDSDPSHEYQETLHKAAALINVLNPEQSVRTAQATQAPVYGVTWRPTELSKLQGDRVLLLDNFDSFTYNLVQDLQALGAEVVVRDHHTPLSDLLALHPSHVLIGPGPGTPMSSGVTLQLAQACIEKHIPLLGVCLGHQAIGELLGGRLLRAPVPVHGKLERILHDGNGLFAGIPSDVSFTRYHSLIVRDLHEPDAVGIARSQDGVLMALQVPGTPAWGVQFHPESVISEHGRQLLRNWLVLGRAEA